MSDEEVEELAEAFARRMERHLGPTFVRNPQIAAKALVKLAPRGAQQIAAELRQELALEEDWFGEPVFEDEESDF